ncbi:acyl-CoA N-acyltransferase, partial [Mycena metata]
LSLMAVDPKYQRRGIGQALLQWGLDRADAEGLEVYLESSEDGLRLYEKNGFESVAWYEFPREQFEGT